MVPSQVQTEQLKWGVRAPDGSTAAPLHPQVLSDRKNYKVESDGFRQ